MRTNQYNCYLLAALCPLWLLGLHISTHHWPFAFCELNPSSLLLCVGFKPVWLLTLILSVIMLIILLQTECSDQVDMEQTAVHEHIAILFELICVLNLGQLNYLIQNDTITHLEKKHSHETTCTQKINFFLIKCKLRHKTQNFSKPNRANLVQRH